MVNYGKGDVGATQVFLNGVFAATVPGGDGQVLPGFGRGGDAPVPSSFQITNSNLYNVTIVVQTDTGYCSLDLSAFVQT